jgi:YegS/Rv2252/BmrU family lipid kinase
MPGGIREALIIFNPKAGRARGVIDRRLERARAILAVHGVETELAITDVPGSATVLARQAVQDRRRLVIVCGGDGTLNEVANGLARSAVPLALLPAGTANVLAKELRLPWDVERAARLLVHSELRRIALGLVTTESGPHHGRYFVSTSGAGPDGAIVNGVNNRLKAHTGTLAYWAEGFKQLARYRFPRFRVTVGDQTIDATLIIVGRTKHYGGPFRITTNADLYDDQFELMLCTARDPLTYLGYIPLLWAGQLRRTRQTYFLRATRVRCEPLDAEPVYLQADGEPAGTLPAEFHVVPDALTLTVPIAPKLGSRSSSSGRQLRFTAALCQRIERNHDYRCIAPKLRIGQS